MRTRMARDLRRPSTFADGASSAVSHRLKFEHETRGVVGSKLTAERGLQPSGKGLAHGVVQVSLPRFIRNMETEELTQQWGRLERRGAIHTDMWAAVHAARAKHNAGNTRWAAKEMA